MNAMAWAWMVSRDLDPFPRLVLMALAARADNHTFECYPSITRIGTDTNMSESAVKRSLATLVSEELVEKVRRLGERGERDQTNIYRLSARMAFFKPDGSGVEDGVHTEPHLTGARENPNGVHTEPLNLSNRTRSKGGGDARAKAKPVDLFPKPDGVDDQVWVDFLVNRKGGAGRRAAPNTPTAHKKLMDDLARISAKTGWTFGQLVEYAAAKGWQGIYEPKEEGIANGNGNGHSPAAGGIGNPLVRAAARREGARRAGGDGEDWGRADSWSGDGGSRS